MSFPTKKAQQLKKQFHSTRKGDDETIESYVKRLKSVADSVAAIDSPISDSDMVLQLVAALPSEYEPVKKIISSKWPLPTFEEACSMVYVQEVILIKVKISFPTEEVDNSNKNEKIPIQDDQIKQVQLRMQFHSTRKGDDETIESYVKRLKSIADSLAAIDSPISDSDMVLQLLAGLPSEYEPVKKIISSRWPLPTFEEACSKAYMLEGILMQVKISFPTDEDDNSNKNEKIPIQDDHVRRAQLKMQFQGTRKDDQETIESYVKRLKSIADSLEEVDIPITDSDMVWQLLAGLTSEYSPVKKLISTRRPLLTFEDACFMVSTQERKFLQDHHEEQNTTDPRVVGEEESSAFTTLRRWLL